MVPVMMQHVFHRLTVKISLASEAQLHRSGHARQMLLLAVQSHEAQVFLGPPQAAARPSTLLQCCQVALRAVGKGRAGQDGGNQGETRGHLAHLALSISTSRSSTLAACRSTVRRAAQLHETGLPTQRGCQTQGCLSLAGQDEAGGWPLTPQTFCPQG